MKLAQSIKKFATVNLDGWNGSSWDSNVLSGDFHTYDRSISQRTFGVLTRTFISYDLLDSQYEVVRTPDGKIFMVAFDNQDIERDLVYNNSYILHQALFTASIIEFTTSKAASGMQSKLVENTLTPVYHCDLERMSSEWARDIDVVRYLTAIITLPLSAPVNTDRELGISGDRYEIREVFQELDLNKVIAAKK